MSITAKELAARLGISAAAVSMALNNKPGVSTKTRQQILHAAEEAGYDFSRLKKDGELSGTVQIVFYKTHNAILSYSPIFNELYEGISAECLSAHLRTNMLQFYEKTQKLEDCFASIHGSDCVGIILIGTEIRHEICEQFLRLGYPLILLDSYFDSLNCTSVIINNRQGAYTATDYLISQFHTQPGHIQCSIDIPNFAARKDGFEKAVKENGMSPSRSIVHRLSPSIEDAMADMLEIIDRGDPLARCYFADNDILAIGAMKAFKLRGLRIPQDAAFIGFDNISESRVIEPPLTTIDVPRIYMGRTAARLLIDRLKDSTPHTFKVEVSTQMVKRLSHLVMGNQGDGFPGF